MRLLKRNWMELWWKMAGGVKSEYEKIVSTELMEFWHLYDIWLDRMKAENERARNNNRK